MLTNFTHVLRILSCQGHQRAPAHNHVLGIIGSEHAYDLMLSLLSYYEQDPKKSDEYWEPVFEAYILAHYDKAHEVADDLTIALSDRRFTSCVACIPAVMVAFIKAAIGEKDAGNPQFHDVVPSRLGSIFRSYQDGMSNVDASEPGMWVLGQFASAFTSYFDTDAKKQDIFDKRISDFCSSLVEIQYVAHKANKFFDEVVMDMLRMMPRPMMAKTVGKAWLSAIALNKANAGTQQKLV